MKRILMVCTMLLAACTLQASGQPGPAGTRPPSSPAAAADDSTGLSGPVGSPEFLPARPPNPCDLPFEEAFDAETLGSLLDLLGLEEWTLAGMNMTDWLPEVGTLPPEPPDFSEAPDTSPVVR